jgi:hypothetical protein
MTRFVVAASLAGAVLNQTPGPRALPPHALHVDRTAPTVVAGDHPATRLIFLPTPPAPPK